MQQQIITHKSVAYDEVVAQNRDVPEKYPRKTVQLSPESHAALLKMAAMRHVDRSMYDVITNTVRWLTRQEQFVQTAIANDVDRGMEKAYADALRKLADELENPTPATFTDVVDEGEDIGKARDRRINERASQELQRPLSVGVIPPPPKKPAKR